MLRYCGTTLRASWRRKVGRRGGTEVSLLSRRCDMIERSRGACRMTDDEARLMRQFGVVLQSIQSDVHTIAQGHAVLNAKLDREHDDTVALAARTERLETAVVALTDRTDRLEHEFVAFRAETQHSFAELRAMLKLSYAEIEGRVTRLEGALTEVLGRLERIEKGTPS